MPARSDSDSPDSSAPAAKLSAEETVRYSRHLMLPEIGLEGQSRLKQAKVLVVGAGGLGSPAAIYLAAAGIGTIGLADFDQVEAHNLQRQILHRDRDLGRAKTESGRDALAEWNPHLVVRLHPEGVTPDNAVELFSAYDFILDGSDNFPTRYLTADAAHLARRPLVYGSLFRFQGQVSVFDTARGGPCYRCLFPEAPTGEAVPNCAEAGVLGALCGVIGSLQATETIKRILDIGQGLSGTLLIVDALDLHFQKIRIRKNPDCPLCSVSPGITSLASHRKPPPDPPPMSTDLPFEMDPAEVHLLLQSDPLSMVLDVREPYERAICRIDDSLDLPMGQIPGSLDQIPEDRTLLVLCHHGHRSARVVQFLRARGYEKVVNIRGGIDAWSRTVDPKIPRY